MTIKEIAKEIGMSPASVSRALNDYKYTSEETKAKVREAAQRLGYRHNALAAGLRNKKSNIIGLIVPQISMGFHSVVISSIQNKLQSFGYNIIVCQSNESPEVEEKLVEVLYGLRVDGIIVSSSIHTTDFSHFKETLANRIPLVFYDRVPKNFPSHKIKGDDYQGGFHATTHLIKQGCKRIAHIGGLLTCSLYPDRFNGYKDALESGGLAYDENMVYFQELTWDNAIETCKKIFAKKNIPDAIFASNDTTAHAVLNYARTIGIKVPDDLKIVGYSNDERVNISQPALSSVEQFPREMGVQAAELMMNLIQKKFRLDRNYLTLTTHVELRERASSLAANN